MGGTTNAALLAQEAGVKRLILSHTFHTFARPGSRERGIVEVGKIYHGEIILGKELMVL